MDMIALVLQRGLKLLLLSFVVRCLLWMELARNFGGNAAM